MKRALKRAIVTLSVWGLIPPAFAAWLIRVLHLEAV